MVVGLHKTAGAVVLTVAGCLFHSNPDLAVVDFVCNRDNRMHTAETLVFHKMAQNGQMYRHTFRAVGIHFVARFVCHRKDSFLVMSAFGKMTVADSLVDMGTGRRIRTLVSGSSLVGEA